MNTRHRELSQRRERKNVNKKFHSFSLIYASLHSSTAKTFVIIPLWIFVAKNLDPHSDERGGDGDGCVGLDRKTILTKVGKWARWDDAPRRVRKDQHFFFFFSPIPALCSYFRSFSLSLPSKFQAGVMEVLESTFLFKVENYCSFRQRKSFIMELFR